MMNHLIGLLQEEGNPFIQEFPSRFMIKRHYRAKTLQTYNSLSTLSVLTGEGFSVTRLR